MHYTNLSESQKSLLMDVTINYLMSTAKGHCSNETDENKQEYATGLLLHLKSHIDHTLETEGAKPPYMDLDD